MKRKIFDKKELREKKACKRLLKSKSKQKSREQSKKLSNDFSFTESMKHKI